MANQEQLDILKQGVRVWNVWRDKNSGVVVDLSRADLGHAILVNADLDGANLTHGRLGWTVFVDIDLSPVKG